MTSDNLDHNLEDKIDAEFRASPEERELHGLMGKAVPSSEVHDRKVLAAAREAADEIAARQASPVMGWRMPAALAASFLLGLGVMFVSQSLLEQEERLNIPADFTRGSGAAAEIPVESASADRWREYIEELIYNGEYRQAEVHLRRFNELHPRYSSD